ncbi:hypothetical protein NC652_037257 [Populus alba x Populus x berolinensis]|nr:hypothetical protein NC652_037257 [Populus alba x Populus x berolinensis]
MRNFMAYDAESSASTATVEGIDQCIHSIFGFVIGQQSKVMQTPIGLEHAVVYLTSFTLPGLALQRSPQCPPSLFFYGAAFAIVPCIWFVKELVSRYHYVDTLRSLYGSPDVPRYYIYNKEMPSAKKRLAKLYFGYHFA